MHPRDLKFISRVFKETFEFFHVKRRKILSLGWLMKGLSRSSPILFKWIRTVGLPNLESNIIILNINAQNNPLEEETSADDRDRSLSTLSALSFFMESEILTFSGHTGWFSSERLNFLKGRFFWIFNLLEILRT